MNTLKNYIKLMRVNHYVKNFLIFLPLFFSGYFLTWNLLYKNLFGFLSFSLLASVIYIINDINDIENDKKHSVKCKRPLPSGAITIQNASILAFILFILALLFNYIASNKNVYAWLILITYFLLNFGYSKGLKSVPIIDVAILALGYLFRVLYGSEIVNIEVSNWLYLTITSISFYLGLGKRRNELLKQKSDTRKVLQFYNYNFLDKNMYMCLTLAILFYSLWTVDIATTQRITNNKLAWTVPLVLLLSMKYSLNIESDSEGDPTEVILNDKVLIVLILIFILIMSLIIY